VFLNALRHEVAIDFAINLYGFFVTRPFGKATTAAAIITTGSSGWSLDANVLKRNALGPVGDHNLWL